MVLVVVSGKSCELRPWKEEEIERGELQRMRGTEGERTKKREIGRE